MANTVAKVINKYAKSCCTCSELIHVLKSLQLVGVYRLSHGDWEMLHCYVHFRTTLGSAALFCPRLAKGLASLPLSYNSNRDKRRVSSGKKNATKGAPEKRARVLGSLIGTQATARAWPGPSFHVLWDTYKVHRCMYSYNGE